MIALQFLKLGRVYDLYSPEMVEQMEVGATGRCCVTFSEMVGYVLRPGLPCLHTILKCIGEIVAIWTTHGSRRTLLTEVVAIVGVPLILTVGPVWAMEEREGANKDWALRPGSLDEHTVDFL